jgi:hypothetical protein
MQIVSMFFIVGVVVLFLFGGIVMMGTQQVNDPSKVQDTFGTSTSPSTNSSQNLAVTVGAAEGKSSGLVVILLAIFIIICIVIGAMISIRGSGLGGNKWRT